MSKNIDVTPLTDAITQEQTSQMSVEEIILEALERPVTWGADESGETGFVKKYAKRIEENLKAGGHLVTSNESLRQIVQITMREAAKTRKELSKSRSDVSNLRIELRNEQGYRQTIAQTNEDVLEVNSQLTGELHDAEKELKQLRQENHRLKYREASQKAQRAMYEGTAEILRDVVRTVIRLTNTSVVKTPTMKAIIEAVDQDVVDAKIRERTWDVLRIRKEPKPIEQVIGELHGVWDLEEGDPNALRAMLEDQWPELRTALMNLESAVNEDGR